MPAGTILSTRNTFVVKYVLFRQAKADASLVLYKPVNELGSDDAWFVHWWTARYPVW
jgi:hypothetical protein